ncbi:hypothetical protein HBNXNv_0696 [Candidatus Nanohalovita haloferacivicina]|nr:hypothetical protein HBNXNv_0696 [Candidatus Nanohalobia archaeon BNXNv]
MNFMVFVFLSHALTFGMLFVASLFDLDTTDVPDVFCATAVLGGLGLHFLASRPLQIGIISGFVSENGFLALASLEGIGALMAGIGDPLAYSIGVGLIFSVIGWGAYLRGMWGGADAFAMSALGFGAPFVGSATLIDPLNLFVNITLAGFIYIMVYTLYRSFQHPEVWRKSYNRIIEDRMRIGLELAALAVFSIIAFRAGMPVVPFSSLLGFMIFLTRFLEVVQDEAFYRVVDADDLEVGEVAAPGQGFGDKIVGLTEEDIENFEGEELEVREGVPFMPVFVLALVLTDVFGAGFLLFSAVF